MCDCKNCDCESEPDNSGFIFGILIGAVIGAVVAILIYKNNQTEVFSDLKEKLEKYFHGFTKDKPSPKIPVVLPSRAVVADTISQKPTSKPRKFIKPKK